MKNLKKIFLLIILFAPLFVLANEETDELFNELFGANATITFKASEPKNLDDLEAFYGLFRYSNYKDKNEKYEINFGFLNYDGSFNEGSIGIFDNDKVFVDYTVSVILDQPAKHKERIEKYISNRRNKRSNISYQDSDNYYLDRLNTM